MLSGVKPPGSMQVLALWSWQACSLLARRDSTFCFIGNLFSWIIKGASRQQEAWIAISTKKELASFSCQSPAAQSIPVSEILFEMDCAAFLGWLILHGAIEQPTLLLNVKNCTLPLLEALWICSKVINTFSSQMKQEYMIWGGDVFCQHLTAAFFCRDLEN